MRARRRKQKKTAAIHQPQIQLERLEPRVLLSGSILDMGFGDQGVVFSSFQDSTNDTPRDVLVTAGGKIVTVGVSVLHTGAFDYHVAMSRHFADGSLDPTFGDGGKVRVQLGGARVNTLDAVSDHLGRIIVSGF